MQVVGLGIKTYLCQFFIFSTFILFSTQLVVVSAALASYQ
jgi:hypothetical protein